MPQFFVVEAHRTATDAYVSVPPQGFDDKYLLLEGVSLLDRWPDGVSIEFSKRHPEGLNLTDALANPFGFSIVSDALKAVLEAAAAPTEFLPLHVLNHKGRVASARYWAVNVLLHLAAVDRAHSAYDVDAFYDDQIDSFERLVLTEGVQEEGAPLFRLQERPRLQLMRDDLVEAIIAQGLTGLQFVPTDEYSTV